MTISFVNTKQEWCFSYRRSRRWRWGCFTRTHCPAFTLEAKVVPDLTALGEDHVTDLGQWHVSNDDISKGLRSASAVEPVSGVSAMTVGIYLNLPLQLEPPNQPLGQPAYGLELRTPSFAEWHRTAQRSWSADLKTGTHKKKCFLGTPLSLRQAVTDTVCGKPLTFCNVIRQWMLRS